MWKRVSCLLLTALLVLAPAALAAKDKDEDDAKAKGKAKTEKAAPEAEGNGATPKKKNGKAFSDVIDGMETTEGLFTFYRDDKKGKVLMEILPEQLDTIMLCSVTRESGDNWYFDSGAMLGEFPFILKRVGQNVQLIHKNVYYRADSDAAVHRALDTDMSDSVMGAAKIEGEPHPERGSILVDPSGFFVQDVQMVGYMFAEFVKTTSYNFDKPNSYFGAINSFPENSEIDVVLTFKSGNPKALPTVPDSRSFQHVYHFSLSSLPDSEFAPRIADDRVGHFLTMYQDYTSMLRDTPYVRYVNRWDLQKAEPKYKLSPPKQPIVYWLENTIPVEYREAIMQGVLVWNKAFEAIGFKDAIVVKQQPDDAEWDAADVRYTTIRWIVNPGGGYAVGPSRTNPFTGQIYDADIRFSADIVRGAFLEVEQEAKPVAALNLDAKAAELGILGGPTQRACDYHVGLMEQSAFGWSLISARAAEMGEEVDVETFINDFLIHVTAHEVGHTLGLRHNFKASLLHDNSDLQGNEARETGLTGSVMDYTPVNIAAVDQHQGAYWQTVIGPYDYWAIEYAYRPVDPASEMSESAMLESIASRVAEHGLAYATDEDTMGGSRGMDPTSNRWDLGANPVGFYAERVELSEELWSKIEDRFETDGERYQQLRQVFNRGLFQYFTAVSNVAKYVGGVYHYRDHIGDPNGRLPFVPVPAAQQRDALGFLTDDVFSEDAFNIPPSLLNKLAPERFWDFSGSTFNMQRLDYPIHGMILAIQSRPLAQLYDGLLMGRILDLELRSEIGEDPLTLPEMFGEVRDAIWSEVTGARNVQSYRRALQRQHLKHLINLVVEPAPGTPEDASTLARADLKALNTAIERALSRGGLDAYTEAHLDETSARIEAALDADLIRKAG